MATVNQAVVNSPLDAPQKQGAISWSEEEK